MKNILCGDVIDILQTFHNNYINCCVTSPPYYGLRDYGVDGQIGLESTPQEYVAKMVDVFREVRRVLRDDGTLWLNLGDSYAGSGKGAWDITDAQKEVYIPKPGGAETSIPKVPLGLKPKDLMGIPWRVAFALQADGWWLRQDIIWHKPNPKPESVMDRCTKAHEYIFLLSKSQKYYYDAEAVKEDAKWERWGDQTVKKEQHGSAKWIRNKSKAELQEIRKRNKRSVWTITTKPYKGAHFATFPPKLIEPCILAGCPEGGIVLDPFFGSGTTGVVATKLRRQWLGIEINPKYCEMASERIKNMKDLFSI